MSERGLPARGGFELRHLRHVLGLQQTFEGGHVPHQQLSMRHEEAPDYDGDLFATVADEEEEEQDAGSRGWGLNLDQWTMHPQGKFRQNWDFLMMALVLYVAWLLPYRYTFMLGTMYWADLVDVIMDLLFLIDLAVNFRTCYYVKDNDITQRETLVKEPRLVMRNYLEGWFCFDALASIPFSLVVLIATGEVRDGSARAFPVACLHDSSSTSQ